MMTHDHFEELCAAASVGQATGEELAQVERHVLECFSCWQAYHDYVSIAAHEFVAADMNTSLSLTEARECLDSELFARRFFVRAEREGIVFSGEVAHDMNSPAIIQFSPRRNWKEYARPMAIAAMVLLALLTGYSNRSLRLRLWSRGQGFAVVPGTSDLPVLVESNRKLSLQVSRLHEELANAQSLGAELANAKNLLLAKEKDDQLTFSQTRGKVLAERERSDALLAQVEKDLARSEIAATNALREANGQRKHASDVEASLVAAQTELNDLREKVEEESAALSRERELLTMGRDVSDLMGARNLHILDVADTDTRGKKRPAFGRIFFTEGKSLVFYAYDLNEAKVQKANYQYQVWAKKEGPNRPSRRLGIFYSDDKAQNRWVFKCDDANIVKEIDSVFVTLGKPNSDPSRPEGARLMFAYLHSAPNHP